MCFATRSLKWPLREIPSRGVMTLVAAPALNRRDGNVLVVGWPDCAMANVAKANAANKLREIGRNAAFIEREFPSSGLQHFEHFTVELQTAKLFVSHIVALTVRHAKRAAQIPQSPAPPGLLPQVEAIAHPGQRDLVRRPVVRAPFANVNAHAFG